MLRNLTFIKPFAGSEVNAKALKYKEEQKELETEKYRPEKEVYTDFKKILDRYRQV